MFDRNNFFLQCYIKLLRKLTNAARRRCLHDLNPRRWSNTELLRLAAHCPGDVVNVSGWKDQDKQGRHYQDYFSNARSYSITNFAGSGEVGDGAEGSLYFDLEGELPESLQNRFDSALCHTVL